MGVICCGAYPISAPVLAGTPPPAGSGDWEHEDRNEDFISKDSGTVVICCGEPVARAVSAAGVGDCGWNKDTGFFTSEAPVPEGLPAPSRCGLPEECLLWIRLCPPKMATCCSGVRSWLGLTPVGDLGCMCEDKLTDWREREKTDS